MSNRILLFSPDLNRPGQAAHDGELLYLGQYLFNYGYAIDILDIYRSHKNNIYDYIKAKHLKPHIVIINLYRGELLIGSQIKNILNQLERCKKVFKIEAIIGIGCISTSMYKEIFEYNSSIDAIVAEYGVFTSKKINNSTEFNFIQGHFASFVDLTSKYLENINYKPNDIASICSSRGCSNNCSFCNYNHNVIGWKERKIKSVISDIKKIHSKHKITKFALFDNNFGKNKAKNKERSSLLAKGISNLNFDISLSLNVSFDGLSETILDNFKLASVKNILVGLESLNMETLYRLYNKKQNVDHCIKMMDYAEKIGIVPIASYILFHPWLTLPRLKCEVEKIERFGRHRIPQFLSNSKLYVKPCTKIEKN